MGDEKEQAQLSAQQEIDVELLKSQIDSMFNIFNIIIKNFKSGNVKQETLVVHNDMVVSVLNMFGGACKDLAKKKHNKNVLIAAYSYFDFNCGQLDEADGRIIQDWIKYAECALLALPLKNVEITQLTIDIAEKKMKGGGLSNFFSKFLGSSHNTERTKQRATKNAKQYRKNNQKAVQETRQKYAARQKMAQCPGQNEMYNVAGGGQNMKFGSALYTPNSKYKPPKQQVNANSDADMKDNSGQQQQYQFTNAVIISAPERTIYRQLGGGQKTVVKNISYPYPCNIEPSVVWNNGQLLGVQYAKPNHDLLVQIDVANLERDPFKVAAFEQNYVQKNQCDLGYPTIYQQQQRQQQLQTKFQ